MGHKGAAVRTKVYQLIAHQVGLQAADAITANAFDGIERPDKVDEAFVGGLSEISDVHTSQHDLLSSLCSSLFSLCHERCNRRITAEPSRIGNGAIGAEVVATVLHLEEIACPVAPRAAGRKAFDVLCLLSIECSSPVVCFSLPRYEGIGKKLNEMRLLITAQHQVDTLNLTYFFGLELSVATGDHHKGFRVLAHQAPNGLTAFPVGHLRYRARVDETDISLLASLHRAHAHFLKHLTESRRLREVQFAAQSIISRQFILKNRSIYHI